MKRENNDVMQQQNEQEIARKGLTQFRELMEEVATLPEEKIEKVTLYTQGFLAGSACGK